MIVFKVIHNFFSMLNIVAKRLWQNLGLSISALIGIVAILSMVVCVPIFAHAVSSETLRQQLMEKVTSTHRRLFSLHSYYVNSGSGSILDLNKADIVTSFLKTRLTELTGLPVERVVREVESGAVDMLPVVNKGYDNPDESLANMRFLVLDTLPQYADIVEGAWPSPDTSTSGAIKVAVSQDLADEILLNVGEHYKVNNLEVEIAGIWKARNPQDPIWFNDPDTTYKDFFWVPEETFRARLASTLDKPIFYVSWYVIVNESSLNFQHSPQYALGLTRLSTELTRLLPGITTDYSPLDALLSYQQRAEALTTLFYTVGAPMIVLALLFIGLTSRIAVQQYEQEIATMRGRGTSWFQVIIMNLAESGFLIVVALPFSIAGGWFGADLMGRTASFLKFTTRTAFTFSFQGLNYLWLGIAIVLIIGARLFPMSGIFHSTIVRMKQEQSRGSHKPFWERFYLDFMLLVPGIYAYLVMRGWTKPAKFLSQLQISGEQYRDPLLFVAPAVFSIAVCMIMLRIVPLLVQLLAALVERLPGVWAYLSLQQIARRSQDHSSALLLIMISLSLAIFSASTAKTLDKWLTDSVYYKTGADLSVQEYIVQRNTNYSESVTPANNSVTVTDASAQSEGSSMVEDHLKLPSVLNVTRVGKYQGTFSVGTGETTCLVMGIDRLDFPKVAYYRDDFASTSLGALMNDLGAEPLGVLLPAELMTKMALNRGDHLTVSVTILDVSYVRDMIVVGTYNYFPTIYPDTRPTLIVNLDSIFDNPDAVVGYDVWLNVKKNTDVEILRYQIRQMIDPDRAVINVVGNAIDEVKKGQEQPERLGLFGVLNVGFIMTGLMPGIGFLLYTYASLQRRFIQLGILQAIGLSVRQLIGYLVLEQSLLMGIAILSGASIGLLTSVLFVPFLQTGAAPGSPVPPFQVLVGWVEAGWLSLAFGAVLFLTMVGTIAYLVRLKVFQAVKMGETL